MGSSEYPIGMISFLEMQQGSLVGSGSVWLWRLHVYSEDDGEHGSKDQVFIPMAFQSPWW